MPNPNRLTTKEVARICRVSDATVKRWAVAGLIKSEKTSGGHRRFRAEDVAAFQCKQGLGLGHQTGDNSFVTTATRSRVKKELGCSDLLRSMICGCEEEVANLLIKRYLDGEGLAAIFDDVLCVEMRRIGRLWVEGKITVAEEHLATRCVVFAMFKLRSVLTAVDQNQKLAVCCGIEGDHHGLSIELAHMVFESNGWSVLNFGPNTPLFSIRPGIENNTPDVVCISGSVMDDVERLTMDYTKLTSAIGPAKPKIILGGSAFQKEGIRKRFQADFYPDSFRELSDLVSSI